MEIKALLKKTIIYKWWRKYQQREQHKQFEVKRANFLAEAPELLQCFSEALNEAGVKFWLDFGTLLGYYRENDFIKHDLDLDTGAYLKDRNIIRKALEAAGFCLVREFDCFSDGSHEECYRFKNTTIDVFYFQLEGEKRYCYLYSLVGKKKLNKVLPAKVTKISLPDASVKKVVFKGANVYIPENTEEILKLNYGPNFMIPNANFDRAKEATNLTFYSYEERPAQMYLKY